MYGQKDGNCYGKLSSSTMGNHAALPTHKPTWHLVPLPRVNPHVPIVGV